MRNLKMRVDQSEERLKQESADKDQRIKELESTLEEIGGNVKQWNYESHLLEIYWSFNNIRFWWAGKSIIENEQSTNTPDREIDIHFTRKGG